MANSRRNVSDGWLRIPVGGVPGNPSAFTSIREAIRDLAEDVQRINVSTTATSASAQTNVTNIVNAVSPTSGTVSSVGLSLPNIFSVSGSPVTTVGTLTATLANQTANKIFAGPVAPPAPPFSIQSLTGTGLNYIEIISVPLSTAENNGNSPAGDYTFEITAAGPPIGVGYEFRLFLANLGIWGSAVYLPSWSADTTITINLSSASAVFKLKGSAPVPPVTFTYSVVASAGGGSPPAPPTFRSLVALDIPNLDASKITSGTFGVARGGTGLNTLSAFALLYASTANTLTTLSPNTTTTRKFLRMAGDGTNGAAPAWDTLTAGDIPSLSGTYLPLIGGTLTGQLVVNTNATGVQYPINVTTTVAGSSAVNVTNTSADASANVRFILNNDANNNAGLQLRSSTHATEPNDAVLYSGSGSINFYTGGNPRVKITSGGQVRIGPRSDSSASATSALELSAADGTATSTILRAFGNTQPSYSTWTANGTFASPSATQTDNTIMAVSGRGYGATGFAAGSRVIIYGRAAENWTDAAQGTYLSFFTTATGSVTPLEKMKLTADGKLGINVTSPQAKLHLSDASTALNGSLFSALDQLILNNDGSGNNPAAIRLVSSNSVGLSENTSGAVVFLGTRGTNAVPAATETLDRLGRVLFQGYTGTGRYTSASIQVFQETSVINSRVPAYITFYTASTTQDQTERMRITSTGNVGIGLSPSAKLDVGGAIAVSGTTVIDSTRRVRASMFAGIDIDNNTANVEWYKIGRLAGYGTTVTIQVNAKNSYNDGNEGGLHTAVFKQGNADNELGGFQWTVTSAPAANTNTFRWLRISDGNYDLYYVASAYTRGELFILDGVGFTEQFAATTDPTGTTELQKLFKTFDPVNFQGGVTTTTISGTTITGTSYTVGATTVIDTSRNLTNIGTIASGNVTINSSGASGVLSLGGPASPGTSVFIQLYRAGTATTRDAYIGYSASTNLDITNEIASGNIVLAPGSGGFVRFNGSGLFMSGTQFMDSSRNLSNIGTVSSGTITSSGNGTFTGNVGAGTASPSVRLDVLHTQNSSSAIRLTNADTGASADARLTLSNGTYETGLISRGPNHASEANDTVLFNSNASGDIIFYTAGNKRLTVTSDGNLLVGVNNNANGGVLQLKSGITFPATRVASTDANTLDDYEEGTFTPSLVFSTGTPTVGYAARVGRYTIVGNQVFMYVYIGLNAFSGGTSSATVTISIGTPTSTVTSNSTANTQPSGVVQWSGASAVTGLTNVSASILPGTSTLTLYKTTTAATTSKTAITQAELLTASSVIEVTLTYYL